MNHNEIRLTMLYVMARLDQRLSTLEFAIGVPQEPIHDAINQLAEMMDCVTGYDKIVDETHRLFLRRKGETTNQ